MRDSSEKGVKPDILYHNGRFGASATVRGKRAARKKSFIGSWVNAGHCPTIGERWYTRNNAANRAGLSVGDDQKTKSELLEEIRMLRRQISGLEDAQTAALSTSRRQLSEAMELAKIVYWQLDPETDTFIFNDPFYAFYGTSAEREGGYLMTRAEYAARFIHPEDMQLFHQASEKRLSHQSRDFFHEFEHRVIRRDGQERHVLARIHADLTPMGQTLRCYGANQDITERKKAEEQLERERLLKEAQLKREKALERSREELRDLSEHLQRVRERERTRIARQVHDELGQFLSALKIDLLCLGHGLDGERAGVLEQIEAMASKIDTGVHTVRKICSDLRPSILEDFGLPAAIEWHAEDFQKRTGIRFATRMTPTIPGMDKRLALILFRIFQETVTNIVRHARATMVRVSLKREGDNVVLRVRDNGKGISKKELFSPGSLGIIGMRERVRYWNGELLFRSVRNKGTAVTVSIPLAANGDPAEEGDYPYAGAKQEER